MSDKLKPCPFCGSEEVYPHCRSITVFGHPIVFASYVYCYKCKTVGPVALTLEETKKKWNTRLEDKHEY